MHFEIVGIEVPLYFLMWGIAGGGCLYLVKYCVEDSVARARIAVLIVALGIALGAKLGYLAERVWFPTDGYFPQSEAGLRFGYRILGGVLCATFLIPISAGVLGLNPIHFGNKTMPLLCGALFLIHFGCLINGCCFGAVADLHWSITYPAGSWAFHFQAGRGEVDPFAHYASPVHPLPAYHMAWILITLVIVVHLLRSKRATSAVQPITYFLLLLGMSSFEWIRPVTLSLYSIVAPLLVLVSGLVALAVWLRWCMHLSSRKQGRRFALKSIKYSKVEVP